MRRIVATGAVAALLMSISACGGPDMGMPTDAPLPKKIDMSDKFDKMKEMAKTVKTTKKSAPGVPGKH